jgi:hypothetical protein
MSGVNWTPEELAKCLNDNKALRLNPKYSQPEKRIPPPSKNGVGVPGTTQKYHNKKTVVDGISFDSKKEADEYHRLKTLKQRGIVTHLELQPKFELQRSFVKNGIRYRAIYYVADFRVKYNDSRIEIIDTKGFKTKEFLIKQKLFEFKYPDLTLTLK